MGKRCPSQESEACEYWYSVIMCWFGQVLSGVYDLVSDDHSRSLPRQFSQCSARAQSTVKLQLVTIPFVQATVLAPFRAAPPQKKIAFIERINAASAAAADQVDTFTTDMRSQQVTMQ